MLLKAGGGGEMSEITNKYIIAYIEQVETGAIKTCIEQKKLIKFIKKVFHNEDIYTDDEIVEKYMGLQRFFPFKLFPWQTFCFVLHMATYRRDGTLRFPELFICVTRGAGKNGYLSFEDFCCVSPIHGVQGYNCSTYATGEQNAKRSFEELYNILSSDKARYKNKFQWNLERIKNYKTNSVIEYKTSNADTKDGGREGKINFDEVHSYKDFRLYNVAVTGLGKKPNARITYTTTYGEQEEPLLAALLEKSHEILFNGADDNGFLPFICCLHSIEECGDPEAWEKANPSLPYFPELKRQYERECASWKANPAANTSFPIKRCNFMVDGLGALAPVSDIEAVTSGDIPYADFKGCEAVVGYDNAQINDMMSIGLLIKYNGIYYWLNHSWICERSADFTSIRYDLKAAEKRGEITILNKEVSAHDPQLAFKWVSDLAKKIGVHIIGGGADFNYELTVKREVAIGLGMSAERRHAANNYGKKKGIFYFNRKSDEAQGAASLIDDIVAHRINCGTNLTMRWFMGNVAQSSKADKENYTELIKIERHRRKTDGFSALLAAYVTQKYIEQQDIEVYKTFRLPKIY